MKKVSFIIDGFNLYHSIRNLQKDHRDIKRAKWLDISALCNSLMSILGKDSRFTSVHYYSALAKHLNRPDVIKRHLTYIKALEHSGVKVHLADFKKKHSKCPFCGKVSIKFEEKESDVAMGVKLLELFHNNDAEIVVIVSGDSDMLPAIKKANKMFPEKEVWCAFPYERFSLAIKNYLREKSFKIKKQKYIQYQFSDPIILKDSTKLFKPESW